jgi:hypothetical protein
LKKNHYITLPTNLVLTAKIKNIKIIKLIRALCNPKKNIKNNFKNNLIIKDETKKNK